jgi:hypothetical protein
MAPALTWPSVLGRALGRSAYNLGRGGYGPYEYLQLLKLFGLAKAPAVVVMQIYEGNDLRDAARFHEYTRAAEAGKAGFLDRAGREPLGVDPVPLLANPLGRHSYAYNLGVVGLASAGGWGRRQLAALGGDSRAQVNFRYRLAFPEGAVAFNIRDHDRDEVRSARDLREARLRLQVLDEALAAFVALARTHGFTPVVAYAPSAYSAYAEFVEFEDPALRELMPWFHRTQVDYLATKARELGFVFADETPALQAQARRHRARKPALLPDQRPLHAGGPRDRRRHHRRRPATLTTGPATADPALQAAPAQPDERQRASRGAWGAPGAPHLHGDTAVGAAGHPAAGALAEVVVDARLGAGAHEQRDRLGRQHEARIVERDADCAEPVEIGLAHVSPIEARGDA